MGLNMISTSLAKKIGRNTATDIQLISSIGIYQLAKGYFRLQNAISAAASITSYH